MSLVPAVELRVYPDDCDAFGHLNQAGFLRMFERVRWETLARGPGMDVFTRAGAWPAIRRATVEYYAAAFPGEALRFDLSLTHYGKSSFSMHQMVRRARDGSLVAAGDFTAVCIDRAGKPVAIPVALAETLGTRWPVPGEVPRHVVFGDRQLTVEVQGDGPSILMIHGFPMDRTLWRPVSAGLTGWQRIIPDLPGFGLSDPLPAGTPGIAALADELARLLDALHVDRAVVTGLSLGGYVAFEFWRRHRARVRALILASTRAESDSPEGRTRRDEMIAQLRAGGVRILADSFVPRLLAPGTSADSAVARTLQTMALDNQPDGLIAAVAAMRNRADSIDLLPSIAVPTLVVAGEHDEMIPPDSTRAIAAGIPGARFEMVAGAAHVAPLEQPERTVTLFSDFLRSLP